MNIYSYMVRHKNGWGSGFGPEPTHCATCSKALPVHEPGHTGGTGYGSSDEEKLFRPFQWGAAIASHFPVLKPGETITRSKAHCYACCAEREKSRMIESGRATLYLSHDDTEQSKGDLEASELRSGRWAVSPAGQLGTCGFYPYPWTVQYVTAGNPADAIKRARAQLKKWVIGNWSGGLSFPCITMHKGSHNIARVRYDVTFRGPDGKQWRGTTYGDNTQICHCRRLKGQS